MIEGNLPHPENPQPTPIPGGLLSFVEAYELAVRTGLRAARKVLDRDDAEDVAMDTGRKVWEEWKAHPEAFVSPDAVRRWAAVVARRAALNLLAKGLSRFQRVDIGEMHAVDVTPVGGVQLRDAQDLARSLEAESLAHTFAIALDGLTPQQYQIHCLKRDDDLSVDDIAAKLGIKPQTVKNQLTTGNAALKRALDVWVRESGDEPVAGATIGATAVSGGMN